MPRVNLYATLRDLTGERHLTVPGKTVREVLENLFARYPNLREAVLTGDEVSDGYSIFVNGRDVRYLGGIDAEVAEDDVLDLFPPVAGGERVVFGGVSPAQFERYLRKWGGTPEAGSAGWWRLPGARVRFWEEPPTQVGAWFVARLGVEVEGEEVERWWRKIKLACMRGGG